MLVHRILQISTRNLGLLASKSATSILSRDFSSVQKEIQPKKTAELLKIHQVNFNQIRLKYDKKKSKSQDKDSDDEASDDEHELEELAEDSKGAKIVKVKVNSLRADLLLKAGLGTARKYVFVSSDKIKTTYDVGVYLGISAIFS
jgi:hypothetical protein